MKQAIIIFVSMCCLSGCATFGQMEKGLNALLGKNIQTAFNVLGYPNGKQVFGNDTVYFWQVNHGGSLILPQLNTTYGTIGTTPVYGTSTSTQIVPIHYNCLIKIITDQYDIIKRWEYRGNIAGCEGYINRLNSYYKQTNQ
jgi:hypothetical protein